MELVFLLTGGFGLADITLVCWYQKILTVGLFKTFNNMLTFMNRGVPRQVLKVVKHSAAVPIEVFSNKLSKKSHFLYIDFKKTY